MKLIPSTKRNRTSEAKLSAGTWIFSDIGPSPFEPFQQTSETQQELAFVSQTPSSFRMLPRKTYVSRITDFRRKHGNKYQSVSPAIVNRINMLNGPNGLRRQPELSEAAMRCSYCRLYVAQEFSRNLPKAPPTKPSARFFLRGMEQQISYAFFVRCSQVIDATKCA